MADRFSYRYPPITEHTTIISTIVSTASPIFTVTATRTNTGQEGNTNTESETLVFLTETDILGTLTNVFSDTITIVLPTNVPSTSTITQALLTSAIAQPSSTSAITQSSPTGSTTTLLTSSTIQVSSTTSTALSPTQSTESHPRKPEFIILGVFIPVVVILAVVATWYYIKTRRHESPGNEPRTSAWRWITTRRWLSRNRSADELPWQMPPEESGRNRYGRYPTPPSSPPVPSAGGLSTTPIPLIPPRAPLRSRTGAPPRPSRTGAGSATGVRQPASPDSYSSGIISERHDSWLSPNRARGVPGSSWDDDDIPLADLPAYDGTRRVFYETALNRSLPFDRLARPSLRVATQGGFERHPSLAPEPLNVVKKAGSAGTMAATPNGREDISSGAHTDPLPGMRSKRDALPRGAQTDPLEANSWAYVAQRALGMFGSDSRDEVESTDDVPIDEEERLRQREETLDYLEGVRTMSPPASYRASSVYSREQWVGEPAELSETSPVAPMQNTMAIGGRQQGNISRQENNTSREENRKRDNNRRREEGGRGEDKTQNGKGKATEDSGAANGGWL